MTHVIPSSLDRFFELRARGTTVGQEARIPYTAEYYFYRAAN